MTGLVVLAPNWLGDAILALPAMADVHRASPEASMIVAARPSIAPLYQLVPWVADTVLLPGEKGDGSRFRSPFSGFFDDSAALRRAAESTPVPFSALLLPNSLRAALIAARAGIRDRWGYRTDCRGPLLTRAVKRPEAPMHQSAYYQHLTTELGYAPGPIEVHLDVPPDLRDAGVSLLEQAGWNGDAPLVALAPGAAYGGAKRWPPSYYAEVARRLRGEGIMSVMVGSRRDAETGREVLAALDDPASVIDLMGRTDLPLLAGALTACRAMVSNDSGAMHFAAAVGVPVAAIFGPTIDAATSPLSNPTARARHRVLVAPVDCRPCMLRECPIDHRCMHGVRPDSVFTAVKEML